MEYIVNPTLTTALTAVDPETGEFDKEAFRDLVLPIRARLMQVDGVTSVFVARMGIQVKYLTEIVSKDKVLEAIREAVVWAATLKKVTRYRTVTDGDKKKRVRYFTAAPVDTGEFAFFPNRNNVEPGIIVETPTPSTPPRFRKLAFNYPSVIANATFSIKDNGRSEEALRAQLKDVAAALLDHPHVVDCELFIMGGNVMWDGELADREEIVAHVSAVLDKVRERKDIFPHEANGSALELVFFDKAS